MRACSPAQLAIIEQPLDAPALLVIAGPGSGKTRVICERIIHLIGQGADPQSIAALTFTQLAAAELRDRVRAISAADVWTGTFHAFAYRVLHTHGALWGMPRPVRVLDERNQHFMIRNAFQAVTGWRCDEFQARAIASQISLRKRRGLTHDEMTYEPDDRRGIDPERLMAIDRQYDQLLSDDGVLDYDDLINRVNQGLRSDDATLEQVRAWCRWLMIDEYQDVSDDQYALISQIAPPRDPRSHLLAVADPRQSIYRFRGANSTRLLERLKRDYDPKLMTLTENYRSVPAVVSCANALQSGAEHPKLVPVRIAAGTPVHLYSTEDPITEARQVTAMIGRRIGEGDAPGTIAVLYSTHRRADILEHELATSTNIPYVRYRKNGLHDRPETEALVALMRCFVDHETGSGTLRSITLQPSWLLDEIDWLRLMPGQTLEPTGDPLTDQRLATLQNCIRAVQDARGSADFQTVVSCLLRSFGPLLDCIEAREWPQLLDIVQYIERYIRHPRSEIEAARLAGLEIRVASSNAVDATLARIMLEDLLPTAPSGPATSVFHLCLGCDIPAGGQGIRLDPVDDRTIAVPLTMQAWRLAQALLDQPAGPGISFVALDLETTSKYPDSAGIIEIGAVRFRLESGAQERFSSLVHADRLPGGIARLTGIRLTDLQTAPGIRDVLTELRSWLRPDDVLVGHNVADFDSVILNRHLAEAGLAPLDLPCIDTLALSRRLMPLTSHELADLSESLGLTPRTAHRALPDAETTRELFVRLFHERARRLPVRALDRALPLVAASLLSLGHEPGSDERLLIAIGGRRLRMGTHEGLVHRARTELGSEWARLEAQLTNGAQSAPCLAEETWEECRSEWLALAGRHAALHSDLAPSDLIGSLALSFQAHPDTTPDRITMMTIHAAKGKEWPTVFIIGAEDDQFPASHTPTPEELEEGNRLLYVGATRAGSRLAILHARQRDETFRSPCRFLRALPDDRAIVFRKQLPSPNRHERHARDGQREATGSFAPTPSD